jgi:hypothetical protein
MPDTPHFFVYATHQFPSFIFRRHPPPYGNLMNSQVAPNRKLLELDGPDWARNDHVRRDQNDNINVLLRLKHRETEGQPLLTVTTRI